MSDKELEVLLRKSLDFLKDNYQNFPGKGFIAGASLGNLVLSFLTGEKPVINDIDVFLLGEVIDESPKKVIFCYQKDEEIKRIFHQNKEDFYYESYGGVTKSSKTKDFYIIDDVRRYGIWNLVKYSSNSSEYKIVLDSFDINAVSVGYSIEEDKFYWTQEFSEFLENRKLKVINLNTPHHTAIRIIKKKNELNLEVEEKEMKLLQYAIAFGMGDISRKSFSTKYYNLYQKYEPELSKWFSCQKNEIQMENVEDKYSKKIDLWSLVVDVPGRNFTPLRKSDSSLGENLDIKLLSEKIFGEELKNIYDTESLLFYVRNVHGSEYKRYVFNHLRTFYYSDDYVDEEVELDDIDFLHRLNLHASKIIPNLDGFKLSQQIKIVKKIFDLYESEPNVAIAVLENMRLDPDKEYNQQDKLLMALLVRRESLTMEKSFKVMSKVIKVFYEDTLK